jgi:hypothetical protein
MMARADSSTVMYPSREREEQRCLAGAGATGDDDVAGAIDVEDSRLAVR